VGYVEAVSVSAVPGMRGEDKPSFYRNIVNGTLAEGGYFFVNLKIGSFPRPLGGGKRWPLKSFLLGTDLRFKTRLPLGRIEDHRSFDVFLGKNFHCGLRGFGLASYLDLKFGNTDNITLVQRVVVASICTPLRKVPLELCRSLTT